MDWTGGWFARTPSSGPPASASHLRSQRALPHWYRCCPSSLPLAPPCPRGSCARAKFFRSSWRLHRACSRVPSLLRGALLDKEESQPSSGLGDSALALSSQDVPEARGV